MFVCVRGKTKKEVPVKISRGKKVPVLSDEPKTDQLAESPNPADIQPG